MELHAKHLSKTYADKKLFEDIEFTIRDKQKIGIIGKNGTGKSTLLKIISKTESFDENSESYIKTSNDLKIAYLKQSYIFDTSSVMQWSIKFISDNNSTAEDYEIKAILNKFDIPDVHENISELSGGQKRRVTLALTLLLDFNLLILDEPTNHLDQNMIQWLEDYLITLNKSIVMITHDRYFLKRICNNIWEIDNQKLYKFNDVSYDEYIKIKSEMQIDHEAKKRKMMSIYKTELKYISRGAKARSSKNKIRVENFEKIKENIKTTDDTDISFNSFFPRLGNEVITLDNISKKFNNNTLFQNFSYRFNNRDKIAIIGENGAGKSTLLKIITQEIIPDIGNIKIGQTANIGYFSQDNLDLDDDMRTLEYINSISSVITTPNKTMIASVFLEQFGFDSTLKQNYIRDLSGGQKRLLKFITILMNNPNILILDEPTNDLDLDILMALEHFLVNFKGVIICVSHDRYFIDKISDYLFVIEDHNIKTFTGAFYDYYLHKKVVSKTNKKQDSKKTKTASKNNFNDKFSYKEQQEFQTIDSIIEELENKISAIDKQIATTTDFKSLQNLNDERYNLDILLQEKINRWYYLNEKHENISK